MATIDEKLNELEMHGFLYHCTSLYNITTIKEHGILSISELKKRGIDHSRHPFNSVVQDRLTGRGLDGSRAISLFDSISYMHFTDIPHPKAISVLLDTNIVSYDLALLISRRVPHLYIGEGAYSQDVSDCYGWIDESLALDEISLEDVLGVVLHHEQHKIEGFPNNIPLLAFNQEKLFEVIKPGNYKRSISLMPKDNSKMDFTPLNASDIFEAYEEFTKKYPLQN